MIDDIGASNARENEYWQSVGGHPDAGYQDVPPHFTCSLCPTPDPWHEQGVVLEEDAEKEGWAECDDCEEWFCKAHHVPDQDCHVELCVECREARDLAAVTPAERD